MDVGDEGWSASALALSTPLRAPRSHKGTCKLPFGVFLSLLVGLAAATAAIAIGGLFFRASSDGNEALAQDLQTLTTLNVRQILSLHSLIPLENLVLLAAQLKLETDPMEVSPLSERLRKTLYAHSAPLFDGTYVGFPDGRLTGYLGIRGALVFLNSTRALGNGTAITFRSFDINDTTGLPTTVRSVVLNDFDVRKEDWYQAAAVAAPNASVAWTNMRLMSHCRCTGIVGALPVYIESRLVAVLSTHLRLETISLALNATKIGNAGEAFVLDEFGNLIGMSNPKRINFTFSEIAQAASAEDPLLRDTVEYLKRRSSGGLANVPTIDSDGVTLAGRAYRVATLHLSSFKPLNWTCVIVIPREDYFTQTDTALLRAIGVGSMIVVLIILAMAFFSWVLLTLPLGRLSRGMDDMANTMQGPRLRKDSFIHEVAIMEKAYGNMATGLNSFSKYVPSPVVQELLKTSREPQVGVSTRVCTFFFSDISDFTSISEVTQPDLLNTVVSEYFSAMETILHGLKGITTDFLGDGLFVFWNAPSYQPDHALLACEAALQQQERMSALRIEWGARGLPQMRIRIGINTGSCLVGNFGSRNHMKYTVMGDAVNVASRLEQLNKQFATSIIIGHETYRQVKARFVGRPLALVTLKGKSESTRVYELVCRMEDATQDVLLLAKQSRALLDAYLQQDFALALGLCRAILERHPDDASTLYVRDSCVECFNSISSPYGRLRLRGGALMDLFAERGLPFSTGAGKAGADNKLATISKPYPWPSSPALAIKAPPTSPSQLPADLSDWSFDAFLYSDNDLLALAKEMFRALGVLDLVDANALDKFLLAVKNAYNNNSYHNWRHACDVAQATVSFLVQFEGRAVLSQLDVLALLVAALCHDLDHPGVNNDFLIRTGSEIAMLYNHQSVLENMHCCLLFKMLQCHADINIFAPLPKADFAYVRKVIIACILSTDLAAHAAIMGQLSCKAAESGSQWNEAERLLLMKCVLKMADISNVARPWDGGGHKWALAVTEEFFSQGDLERSMGLDVARFMDRRATTLAANSVSFIDYVAAPLFVALGKLYPAFEQRVVAQLHANRELCKADMNI